MKEVIVFNIIFGTKLLVIYYKTTKAPPETVQLWLVKRNSLHNFTEKADYVKAQASWVQYLSFIYISIHLGWCPYATTVTEE